MKVNLNGLISGLSRIGHFHGVETGKIASGWIDKFNKLPGFDSAKALAETVGDIGWLQYFLGSLKNADNNILKIVHNVVVNAKKEIHRFTYCIEGRTVISFMSNLQKAGLVFGFTALCSSGT